MIDSQTPPDSHTALEIIREMEAIVLRLTPTTVTIEGKEHKNICLHDTIRESEAELYRRLGAIVGKDVNGNLVYAIPCQNSLGKVNLRS